MSQISRSQSEDVQTSRKQGFNICCLMAGSGSLFCTYIGFPSPDVYVRFLFRFSSVGFFAFTVIGYAFGYESSNFLKTAALHMALVFSNGGLGLCGAYWMEAVPRLLLLILSIFTCVFQAVCVHFQLEGSGMLLHTGLTALLPALASVGPGVSSDVINDSLSAISEQEARILQADDGEFGETWAYKIIVAAVCVIVGTVFLAVCRVWQRRHDMRRQQVHRVEEWHDAAIGKTSDGDHISSLDENNSEAAYSTECVADHASRASFEEIIARGCLDHRDLGSNGDVQASSQTTTASLSRTQPTTEHFDEAVDAGQAVDRAVLCEDHVDVRLLGCDELPTTNDASRVGESLASMMQVFNVLGSMNADVFAPETDKDQVVAFDGLEELHDDLKREFSVLTSDTLSLSCSSCSS
eukprot:TRINITY_DN71_c0_g1_i3.p1 TRINITY_DN71_c0_g1~~TRINITY_DN71_c0_g1_i3.p1  ORF type:complete len:409 (+),score=44.54 TRINITY_DN71_c0_g1_i3:107-1333(+)